MTSRASVPASTAEAFRRDEVRPVIRSPGWWLWPREHGSYPQLGLPLATALLIGSLQWASALLFVAAVCAFFAHEPVLVLLGHRGRSAKRATGGTARRMLALLGLFGAPAAVWGLATSPLEVTVASLVPLLPALCLIHLIVQRREQTAPGLLLAALALSCAGLPVALAGGASLAAAVTSTGVWCLSYAVATLAVHHVIEQIRARRRDQGRWSPSAIAGLLIALLGTGTLAGLAAEMLVPWLALAAALPVSLASAVLFWRPPRPQRLRTVGWTLAGASVLTLTFLIMGLH